MVRVQYGRQLLLVGEMLRPGFSYNLINAALSVSKSNILLNGLLDALFFAEIMRST